MIFKTRYVAAWDMYLYRIMLYWVTLTTGKATDVNETLGHASKSLFDTQQRLSLIKSERNQAE